MKKLLTAIMTLGAVALIASCQNPTFAGTQLTAADTAAATTAANAPHTNTTKLTAAVSGTLNAGAATNNREVVVVTFTGGSVDAATLTAVTFYNVAATADAEGARARGTAITPVSSSVVYDSNADTTTVYYYLDLSTAANVSSRIEVAIDPATLTANGGSKKLNMDNDLAQGETQDDAVLSYLNVTGAGITAAGSAKNPRRTFIGGIMSPAAWSMPTAGTAAANLQITWTYGPATNAIPDATDYKAMFDIGIKLQKFTGGAWVDVTTTTSYSTTTGVYVITLPANAGEEVWRYKYNYSTSFVTAKNLFGYVVKPNYDQTQTIGYSSTMQVAAITASYDTATATGASANASFQGNYNGVITVTVNTGAAQGLTGVSASTVKVYDTITQSFIAVASASALKISATQDQIIINLPASYRLANHNYQVFLSPDIKEGSSTAATSDDLKLGDWTNTSTLPYGWAAVGTNNGQI